MVNFKINDDSINYFSELMRRHEHSQFVEDRIAKCVTGEKRPVLSTELFWSELVKTINTSQTKSIGLNNPMDCWIKRDYYNVKNWEWVADKTDEELYQVAKAEFTDSKIRFPQGKAKYLPSNRNFLLKNESELLHKLNDVEVGNKVCEKEVVDLLTYNFKGLGLKQSRNLLQDLGRAQYQVPIDSRVKNQLEKSGIYIGNINLGNEDTYLKVQDVVWTISKELGVLPCVFDAFAFINDS